MKRHYPNFASSRHILKSLALVLSLGFTATAQALPVFTETIITSDTDILNSGNLVIANDLGASPNAVTVNGVTFGTSSAGLSGFSNGSGDFSTDAFSTSLDAILSDLVFDSSFGSPATLTLGGLTIGSSYVLQLLFSNDLNPTGDNINVLLDGSTYHLDNWRPSAINLTVEFTASSTTLVTSFGPGSGANSTTGRAVLNAYALHSTAVPEPGSLALLGLGLMGFISQGRRRKQS